MVPLMIISENSHFWAKGFMEIRAEGLFEAVKCSSKRKMSSTGLGV